MLLSVYLTIGLDVSRTHRAGTQRVPAASGRGDGSREGESRENEDKVRERLHGLICAATFLHTTMETPSDSIALYLSYAVLSGTYNLRGVYRAEGCDWWNDHATGLRSQPLVLNARMHGHG